MKRFLRFATAGVVMAAIGCTRAANTTGEILSPGSATLDDTLVVALNTSAVTRDNAVRVWFAEKLDDSRCPIGVTCVWQGDVGAKIRVETLTSATDGQVHTAIDPREVNTGTYRVTLLGMSPHPGDTKAPPQIVATIRVQR